MISYTLVLSIGSSTYQVLVTRKKIKSLRLRIDGMKITLSTPRLYPKTLAKNFVMSKIDWISKHLAIKYAHIDTCTFENNSKILILGKPDTIKTIPSKKFKIELQDETLVISQNQLSGKQIEIKFIGWAKKYFLATATPIFTQYYETIFLPLGINKPNLKIRAMKSMWGNCKYLKNEIVLNLFLLKTPIECIEYVILHELAHTIYHNHGKDFKRFLSTFLPNWQQIKRKLRDYSLHF